MITCLRSLILLFSFLVQAKRLRCTIENNVNNFFKHLSTGVCIFHRTQPIFYHGHACQAYIRYCGRSSDPGGRRAVTNSRKNTQEDGREAERKKGLCPREHINLSLLAMTTAVLQTFFTCLHCICHPVLDVILQAAQPKLIQQCCIQAKPFLVFCLPIYLSTPYYSSFIMSVGCCCFLS